MLDNVYATSTVSFGSRAVSHATDSLTGTNSLLRNVDHAESTKRKRCNDCIALSMSRFPEAFMNIVIRPLAVADFTAAVQLWSSTPGVRVTETPAMYARFLARNPELSCAAWAEEELVGAVLCGHDGRRGYLYHLAVDQAYRQRGIAREMLAYCLARLTTLGIEKCSAFLLHDNHRGREFWLHLGWRERVDLIVLAHDLPAPDSA
jgi:ribosomal protein S18 acetylase RimI-like enzyme